MAVITTDIDHLGLDRVLKRGTGEIIERHEDALYIRDTVSGACLLACGDNTLGGDILERRVGPDCRLLMVSNHALGCAAFERCGFAEMLECRQVAYFGDAIEAPENLAIRCAEEGDVPLLLSTYDLVGEDELRQIVARRRLFLGCDRGQIVGFIGEHLEGSMGLLYVFPQFRRKGYAVALEKHLIARTLDEGFTPFGQVEKSNRSSLALQEKLGMTVSGNLICWMWR